MAGTCKPSTRGAGRQTTLNFNHRVTKNAATAARSAKEASLKLQTSSPFTKSSSPAPSVTSKPPSPTPPAAQVLDDSDDDADAPPSAQPRPDDMDDAAKLPDQHQRFSPSSVGDVKADFPPPTHTPIPQPPESSAAELVARQVSNSAVARYARRIANERRVRAVHQSGLSAGEKVLRYFDMSSEYGPCIGMPRRRRWHRAHRLGLDPPIEVLAVLLREQDKEETQGQAMERAHMDEIMNPLVSVA